VSGGPPRVFIDTCLRSATRFPSDQPDLRDVESTADDVGLKVSRRLH